jgi:hypothetical protein
MTDDIPAPGFAHPAYGAEDLSVIRLWLAGWTEPHLVLPAMGSAAYGCECALAHDIVGTPRTRVFTMVTVALPALWTARRFQYRIAVDDLGRAVASEIVLPCDEPADVTYGGAYGAW